MEEQISVSPRCEDQPCVTGDWFVAGFAHQVTANAGAEVEAFPANAEWFKARRMMMATSSIHCTCTCRGVHLAGSRYISRHTSTGSGILGASAFACAVPVAATTVGFGSFSVEPIVLNDDSGCSCERYVHAGIASTNAAKAENAIADISSLTS